MNVLEEIPPQVPIFHLPISYNPIDVIVVYKLFQLPSNLVLGKHSMLVSNIEVNMGFEFRFISRINNNFRWEMCDLYLVLYKCL